MSIPFYWFEKADVIQVTKGNMFCPSECLVTLTGGYCTSHSSGNLIPIQKFLCETIGDDFTCIWWKEHKTLIDSNKSCKDTNNVRIEKLYTYNNY